MDEPFHSRLFLYPLPHTNVLVVLQLLLLLLLSLFFAAEDVGGNELYEFFIEDFQNFPSKYVQLGLLVWQVVLQRFDEISADLHFVVKSHVDQLLFLFFVLLPLSELESGVWRRLRDNGQRHLLAEERALQSERVGNVELSEHHDSGCGLLLLLDPESALVEGKSRVLVAAKQRYYSEICILDSAFVLVVFVGATVEEGMHFARVAVHVAVQNTLSLNMSVTHHQLRVKDFRVEEAVRCPPFAIEVNAEQAASIVSINHAITVQHRHNFEYKIFSQLNRELRVPQQEVQCPLQHERSLWLAWMDSTRQYDRFFVRMVLDILRQPLAKVFEAVISLHQGVDVVFVEALDLLLKGSIEQPLDFAFAVLALLQQLPGLLVFLSELLLDDRWELVLDFDFFVVVLIRVYVGSDR